MGAAHYPFRSPTFGSNRLFCESVFVNMADIKLASITRKMILFVKPAWYSSRYRLNHLVAASALSLWNISLSDPIVPSLATSLKWAMIINPTGHVQWNLIDLHISNITGIHSNTETSRRRGSAGIDLTFHFEFLFTARALFFHCCCCCYAGWTLKTHFEGWVIRMQSKSNV